MRNKEQISDNFTAIQRHLMVKQDISKEEAYIQALQVLTEVLVDIRTNLKAIEQKLPEQTHKATTQDIKTSLQDVT
jgi:hypothetical protein